MMRIQTTVQEMWRTHGCGIGVARGCSGCTCTPQSKQNFFRRNLQGKLVSAPPAHQVHPRSQESIFRLGGEILEVGVVYLVVLERFLRMTNKMVVNFFEEKVHPPLDKILATPMG